MPLASRDPPASSTLAAAGGNSGPVQIRNGAHGHRLKQFLCNGEIRTRTDLPSVALPATAEAQLCHQPLPQDRCHLSICAPAPRGSQDPSPQRCFPSPTTPSAHPVTTLPRGFASERQHKELPLRAQHGAGGPDPWFSLCWAPQPHRAAPLHTTAASCQAELASSPSSFFTPVTGIAKLRSHPHSFILTSNRLCFAYLPEHHPHTGRYGMKPLLLEVSRRLP